MTHYHIGAINYLNSLPINAYLEKSLNRYKRHYSFQVIWDHPAALNQLLQRGNLHLSVVSSIHYALYQKDLLILPQLSISSLSTVHSVLLFSREPLTAVKQVALPDTSATSIYQLQILLSYLSSSPVDFVLSPPDLEEMLQVAPAALLIGDDALKASWNRPPGVSLFDVGSLWYEQTGEMMVHALWVVRRQVAVADPVAVSIFHQAILAARDQGLSQLEDLLLEVEGMEREEARRYYAHLYYGLGEGEIRGLKRFFAEAHRLSLIQEPVELNFWGDESCSEKGVFSPASL